MACICILIHHLRLPQLGDSAALSKHAWNLSRKFAAAGHAVELIHTDPTSTAAVPELSAAAKSEGVRIRFLCEAEPAYDVPLFPGGIVHPAAHRLAAMLATRAPDACLVLDEPAYAAIAILRRRTGSDFQRTQFTVVADAKPRELARLAGDHFPSGGREEMIHDYLERCAFNHADRVVVSSPDLGDALQEARLVTPAQTSVLPALSATDDLAGWRAFLEPAPLLEPKQPSPKITLCIPYYDQPRYFAEALATLAAQTEAPHEVILLDDGTPSEAGRAAYADAEKRYAPRGWKFLRQANAGPAAARNRLVELATGDAVLFCDHDNRFHPEMIAALAQAYALSGADCITCAFRAFSANPDADPADRGYVFSPLSECEELGLVENALGDNNFLVRRSTFLALGGFSRDREANEDWQFLLDLLRTGGRIAEIPTVLFEYRRLPTSKVRRQGEFASALHTLAPILAASAPAWRRAWPHFAGAIREPQVPKLEHALRAAELEHQAALAKVKAELVEARHSIQRKRWEIVMQKAAAERARQDSAMAKAAHDEATQRIAALESELAAVRQEREQAVTLRDDKIRRMQASWSWQATAPGRALRRALVDPVRRPKPATEPSATTPAKPQFAVDRPAYWDAAPAAGVISGWCVFGPETLPAAFRATLDGEPLHGGGGLERKDVVAAHGFGAFVQNCGFEFRYRAAVDGRFQVRVEAQSPDGEWHLLHDGALQTSSRPRDVRDYTAWVENYGTVTPEKAAAIRGRLQGLRPDQQPLISVLMPVHNSPERWLIRAIESVREQLYEKWELCIADDGSSAPHVRTVLEKFSADDPRIRVVYRATNGHISEASNSALEIARGQFTALLDHDDELPPDALAEVVFLLVQHPETDLVYSDEDKIDENGRRFSPYFKPQYLPDLLLGQNCISHLSVYRTELLRRVGGFRAGYEGSQDWDLALRVVDASSPDRVRHIPKILYHWRAITGSTAVTVSAKNYSVAAARRALTDHFARRQLAVELRPVPGDHWQVVYPLPEVAPLVSIILPTKNAADLVKMSVGSIFARTEYPRFEIIVINNRSDDPATLALFDELRDEDRVRVIDYDAPFNYSAINNFGVRHARGDVLCFLNNDVEVITGRWLEELVSHALRPEIGAVGPMLYYPNNTIQHAGVILGLAGVANHAFLHYPHGTDGYMNRARLAQNYSAVTGACLVVRRAVFEEVGGFNTPELPVAFNDIDLCLRIRAAGYWNLWTPFAELYHHESATRGKDETAEKKARFVREVDYMRQTWGTVLDRDPAYNPNLSADLLGWALAWPPRT